MTVSLTARGVASSLMARFGSEWNRSVAEASVAAYLPLHAATIEPGIETAFDVPYGPHGRQKLDVYRPVNARNAPVLVFFHGGGLNSGDKQLPESQGRIYANIGRYFARHGIVTLIANYRLVPEAKFPSGGEDVAQAVAWARREIQAHGGDPARLTLFGNSAGAVHVATYLFGDWRPGQIERAILLSTPCTMPQGGPREPVTSAYYGPEATKRADFYPLGLLRASSGPCPPVHFMTAEFDPDEILQPCQAFADEFRSRYGELTMHTVPGHNHISTVLSIGTDDDTLGKRLLEVIDATP